MARIPSAKPQQLKLTDKEPTLLFAIQDLIRTGGMNFDEWWEDFRLGNPKRINDKLTNFPLKDHKKPKYIEKSSIEQIRKTGVRELEYFPDADDESVSHQVRGNDHDLIFHITAIGYQSAGSSEKSIPGKNSNAPLKGFPALELEFISEDGKLTGLKIIRCPGYTDDENVARMNLAKLIKPTDITGWSRKIKTIFGDTKYVWRKGYDCVSYTGHIARLQGLSGHAFVRSETDGIALFTALLKIHDAIPDKGGFNFSGKTDKTKFTREETTTILNKPVKLDKERQIGDCYFYQAKLRLPLLKKPIPLVRKNVIVYKS